MLFEDEVSEKDPENGETGDEAEANESPYSGGIVNERIHFCRGLSASDPFFFETINKKKHRKNRSAGLTDVKDGGGACQFQKGRILPAGREGVCDQSGEDRSDQPRKIAAAHQRKQSHDDERQERKLTEFADVGAHEIEDETSRDGGKAGTDIVNEGAARRGNHHGREVKNEVEGGQQSDQKIIF